MDIPNITHYKFTSPVMSSTNDVKVCYSPKLIPTVPIPVACHFFFPTTEIGDESIVIEEEQEDPLSLNSESVDTIIYQPNHITVEDELLVLENLPTTSVASFSIVDPLGIAESEIHVKKDPDDTKPTTEQIDEITRKRKNLPEYILEETVPAKKEKIEQNKNCCDIVLKELKVNIGPKLPLPQCFRRNNAAKVKPLVANSPLQLLQCKKCDFTCQDNDNYKRHMKEHIVIKIYSCYKCNHKCTDLVSHEAHVASCVVNGTAHIMDPSIHNSVKTNNYFSCEFCIYKFRDEYNLIVHENKHSRGKNFPCFICGLDFPTVDRLCNHHSNSHKSLTRVITCNSCDYSSMSSHQLKEHIVRHNADKHLFCYKCRHNCEDVIDYDEHLIAKHIKKAKRKMKHKKNNRTCKVNESGQQHIDPEQMLKLKNDFESEIIYKDFMYYCNGCTFKFVNVENLVKHKEQHLNVSKPYRCLACSYESLSVVNIGKHLRVHPGNVKIACNICDISLEHRHSIRHHAVSHLSDELYCSICQINFEDTTCSKQHSISVHKQINEKYICSKQALTPSVTRECIEQLRSVKENKPGENKYSQLTDNKLEIVLSKEKQMSCFKSNKPSKLPLLQVEKECNEGGILKIEVNKLKFDGTISHEEHRRSHIFQNVSFNVEDQLCQKYHAKQMIKCGKCNYNCSKLSSFVRHNKSFHVDREKPYICSICNHKSLVLKFYMQHVKRHVRFVLFSCRYCQYTSKRERDFAQHIGGHELKCCPMCVFKTQRMQLFRDHFAKQHKPGNGPYLCSLCPYNTRFESALSLHCLRFHPKEYTSLKLPLPSHLKQSIKNQPRNIYACTLCDFKSNRMYDLKKHVIRHFINGSINSKTIKYKQNQQNVKQKIQKKTLPFKTVNPSNRETSKPVDKKLICNEFGTLYYGCSQCQYKNKYRKNVSKHLRNIHNIIGGIRNHMIVKLRVKSEINAALPQIKQGRIKPNNQSIISQKSGFTRKCTKCNIHKLSHFAQRDHDKIGHELFWKKPFSCVKCGVRCINNQSFRRHLQKHEKNTLICKNCNFATYRLDSLKLHCDKCLVSTKNPEKQETRGKNPEGPHQKIKTVKRKGTKSLSSCSDDENYSCGECTYVTPDVTDLITHMFIHSGIPDD